MKLKVQDKPDLLKDSSSGVVINNNSNSYMAAKKRKALMLSDKKEKDELKNEIAELKKIVSSLAGK